MKTSVETKLKSTSFRKWLDAPVFVLDDVSISRQHFATLTESPCTRAAQNTTQILRRMQVTSLKQVYAIGLDGFLRCKGLGERSAWVVACVLDEFGYNVETWIERKPRKVVSWKGAIADSAQRVAHRKHA